MEIEVEEELVKICRQILGEKREEAEWAEVESDDMYQSVHYCGGFDATEGAFCFSYSNGDSQEFWFQVTLEEIAKISSGQLTKIELHLPDK